MIDWDSMIGTLWEYKKEKAGSHVQLCVRENGDYLFDQNVEELLYLVTDVLPEPHGNKDTNDMRYVEVWCHLGLRYMWHSPKWVAVERLA